MNLSGYLDYADSGVTWLGAVPSHWTTTRLKFLLAGMGTGGTPDTDNAKFWASDESGTPWVAIGDLSERDAVKETAKALTPEGIASKGLTVWPIGTLLFSMYASLGHTAELAIAATTNQAILALLPSDEVNQRFLCRWLEFLKPKLKEHASSNTQDNLNAEKVRNLYALKPPLHEQTAIATFLDRETAKTDVLIAAQEKLINLLAEKRQAIISNAVTRGLNPDAPVKDSGKAWLGKVPEHWRLLRVKAISRFSTSGPRGWSDRITEDGSLFIQSGDLNDALGIDFSTAKRVSVKDDAEAARTLLADGDVVVCITGAKTGNVAVCASLLEPAYVNQHLCLIRPAPNVLPAFLAVALKSKVGQTQFELSQYGLKQGLSLENVREVLIPLPPYEEQKDLITFLQAETSRLDCLKTEAERAITLLKERRSALISAAVTGQIDVRGTVLEPTLLEESTA